MKHDTRKRRYLVGWPGDGNVIYGASHWPELTPKGWDYNITHWADPMSLGLARRALKRLGDSAGREDSPPVVYELVPIETAKPTKSARSKR